jgi:hypothetical protein
MGSAREMKTMTRADQKWCAGVAALPDERGRLMMSAAIFGWTATDPESPLRE